MAKAAPSIPTFRTTHFGWSEAANDNALVPAPSPVKKKIFIPGWPALDVGEEPPAAEARLPRFAPGWP